MMIAVIDMGTNTFNLLLSEVSGNYSLRHIYSDKISVKLGHGSIQYNLLSASGIDRALHAINRFYDIIADYPGCRVAIYATEAIRAATNRDLILLPVQKKFLVDVEVISGTKEAELICKGVRQAVEMDSSPVLILDIGGGSNELIIADNQTIFWSHSYPLGVTRLAEAIHPSDPIQPSEVLLLIQRLEEEMHDFFSILSQYKPKVMIGSSGAFDSFADMIFSSEPVLSHPYAVKSRVLPIQLFNDLYDRLLPSTFEQRLTMRGLVAMRADLIVLAAVVVKFLITKGNIQTLIQSEYALKEGAAEEFIQRIAAEGRSV